MLADFAWFAFIRLFFFFFFFAACAATGKKTNENELRLQIGGKRWEEVMEDGIKSGKKVGGRKKRTRGNEEGNRDEG